MERRFCRRNVFAVPCPGNIILLRSNSPGKALLAETDSLYRLSQLREFSLLPEQPIVRCIQVPPRVPIQREISCLFASRARFVTGGHRSPDEVHPIPKTLETNLTGSRKLRRFSHDRAVNSASFTRSATGTMRGKFGTSCDTVKPPESKLMTLKNSRANARNN